MFSLLASLTLHPARFIFQKGSMANSLQLTQLRHILQTLRITPDSYLPFFIKSNYLELWQYWGANKFFSGRFWDFVPKRGVGGAWSYNLPTTAPMVIGRGHVALWGGTFDWCNTHCCRKTGKCRDYAPFFGIEFGKIFKCAPSNMWLKCAPSNILT